MESLCDMSEFNSAVRVAKTNGQKPYKAVIGVLNNKAAKIENEKRLESIKAVENDKEAKNVKNKDKEVEDEGR